VLTAAELGDQIDACLTRSAFRLELLDRYTVGSDGSDVERYLRGEPEPDPERKQPWLDRLSRERDAGIHNHRVHVLSTPLTDYLRYECEWGYVPNAAAGEDIRIVNLAERAMPDGLVDHDFWLVDDQYVFRMYYDPDGRLLGAEGLDEGVLPIYRRARDEAVAASVPFPAWWAAHPEEWREHRT